MKKIILTISILALFSAHYAMAEDGGKGGKGEHFAERKAEMLQHMDAARNCIQGAADHEAVKACHEQAKQERKAHHDKMMQERESRKAERDSKRQEKQKQ